ncbi:uncharacterized protein ARMOST_21513 [Armillaria ostoyae]|uniref:Uncharacterized protein n=1 Tax=Armillaria ostoyae TaxID=47428 RepID=A0A284SAA9_ARMOS|nr:uncharacterized protein ARMOST_21513 [Armillaria ostoyae]
MTPLAHACSTPSSIPSSFNDVKVVVEGVSWIVSRCSSCEDRFSARRVRLDTTYRVPARGIGEGVTPRSHTSTPFLTLALLCCVPPRALTSIHGGRAEVIAKMSGLEG